jgi:hypothetical protein
MLGIKSLRGFDNGTESSLISASAFFYYAKGKGRSFSDAIGCSEAEEERKRAEFLTVSQLMELAGVSRLASKKIGKKCWRW